MMPFACAAARPCAGASAERLDASRDRQGAISLREISLAHARGSRKPLYFGSFFFAGALAVAPVWGASIILLPPRKMATWLIGL